MLLQIVQILGAFLVLLAFMGLRLQWYQGHSWAYLALNALGAATLGVAAVILAAWGFIILNVVWLLVTLHGVYANLRQETA